MEITLLGTGGSLPTKKRFPLSIALSYEGEILLFDCGEGTQIQFQKAGLRPGKLSKVLITHFHGDHFYGLPGLLTSLQLNGREKPLTLFALEGIQKYVQFMQEFSHFKLEYPLLFEEVAKTTSQKTWEFRKYYIQARPLDHTATVLGYRFEEKPRRGKFNVVEAEKLGIPEGPLRNRLQKGEEVQLPDGRIIRPQQVIGPPRPGKKVAICLDTRPCENAIELAREADLLIHDGSFDESQTDWAQTTVECPVVQAAEVARTAGARRLVLTHISARYKERDEGLLLQQAQKIFPDTILGRDLMKIEV